MSSHAHSDDHPDFLAHHFDTPIQQFNSAKLGMWAFLAQEILFFSGVFVAYGIFRTWYPEAWSVGSHLLDWKMGAINTAVLLFSSLTAVLAVHYAQLGDKKKVNLMLWLTILCACGFMVIKYFEYTHKFHVGFFPGSYFNPTEEGLAEITKAIGSSYHGEGIPFHLRSWFGLYFVMTGLHGLHVVIGIGILLWMIKRNSAGEFGPQNFTAVDNAALYWHLVDLVWIYLFPLLYLID